MRPLRRGWLPGVVVGLAVGVAALEVGALAWILAAAFAVPAVIVGPRRAAIGGLFTGSGAIWLVLLGRVAISCRAADGEIGCQAPWIEGWLAAAGVQLGLGLALTLLALLGDHRGRAGGRAGRAG